MHAEDADVLTLSVQADLQQREATQVKRNKTGSILYPFADLPDLKGAALFFLLHENSIDFPEKLGV